MPRKEKKTKIPAHVVTVYERVFHLSTRIPPPLYGNTHRTYFTIRKLDPRFRHIRQHHERVGRHRINGHIVEAQPLQRFQVPKRVLRQIG